MYYKLVMIGLMICCGSTTVAASKIPIPNSNRASAHVITEMAVKILTKNYADNREILIHGDSSEFTIRSFQDLKSFGLMVFDNPLIFNNDTRLRLHRNSFVMSPRSVSHLEKILGVFKQLTRWNIYYPSVILDRTNKKCENAQRMLEASWKMYLVESFFLCTDSHKVPMIFTYNPYTNRAPDSWKQVPNTVSRFDGWTMYARQYHDRDNITEGFHFDRTKNLDGSVIKISVKPFDKKDMILDKDYDKSTVPELYRDTKDAIEKIEYSLNAIPIFNAGDGDKVFEYIDTGSCDLLLGKTLPTKKVTYPVIYVSYHIVANNKGFYSPLEKIKNYYGIVTLISMCIILLMTYLVIVFCGKRRRWSFAGFEILRLLINAALHSPIDTLAKRIFFSMIFLYFLIMQATFSGHIAAFLTKQQLRRNAETLADLRDPQYKTIYIHWTMEKFITDPILKEKLVLTEANCISKILGDESAVCICTDTEFLKDTFENDLHVSTEPVIETRNVYRIRDDWPLRERFDTHLMWLQSSGHSIQDYNTRYNIAIRERQKRAVAARAIPDRRPISLWMLDWAFIFLLVGLKLAAMSLTVERKVKKKTKRIRHPIRTREDYLKLYFRHFVNNTRNRARR